MKEAKKTTIIRENEEDNFFSFYMEPNKNLKINEKNEIKATTSSQLQSIYEPLEFLEENVLLEYLEPLPVQKKSENNQIEGDLNQALQMLDEFLNSKEGKASELGDETLLLENLNPKELFPSKVKENREFSFTCKMNEFSVNPYSNVLKIEKNDEKSKIIMKKEVKSIVPLPNAKPSDSFRSKEPPKFQLNRKKSDIFVPEIKKQPSKILSCAYKVPENPPLKGQINSLQQKGKGEKIPNQIPIKPKNSLVINSLATKNPNVLKKKEGKYADIKLNKVFQKKIIFLLKNP